MEGRKGSGRGGNNLLCAFAPFPLFHVLKSVSRFLFLLFLSFPLFFFVGSVHSHASGSIAHEETAKNPPGMGLANCKTYVF